MSLREVELALYLETSSTAYALPAYPGLLMGIWHLLAEHMLSYVDLPDGLSDLLLRHVHHVQAIVYMRRVHLQIVIRAVQVDVYLPKVGVLAEELQLVAETPQHSTRGAALA